MLLSWASFLRHRTEGRWRAREVSQKITSQRRHKTKDTSQQPKQIQMLAALACVQQRTFYPHELPPHQTLVVDRSHRVLFPPQEHGDGFSNQPSGSLVQRGVDQHPGAGGGGEGDPDKELGVVGQPRSLGCIRPALGGKTAVDKVMEFVVGHGRAK